ncbi:hypothetical protein ABFS82_11G092100 [Erythranthe guttata]
MAAAAAAETDDSGGNFECNICLDIAKEPVITLCGHLHCWPCLYKWLRSHSICHECPVCKTLIHEEKLIPLYGRGNTPTDPRSIPNRPLGRRPETAAPPPPPAELLSVQFREFWGVRDFYGGLSGYGYGYPYLDGSVRLNNESSDVEGNYGNLKRIRFWFISFLLFAFIIM